MRVPQTAPLPNSARALLTLRFGAYLAKVPPIFAAFSQGANLARRLLIKNVSDLSAGVLAEGGAAYLLDPSFGRPPPLVESCPWCAARPPNRRR
jgi:predicted esterase